MIPRPSNPKNLSPTDPLRASTFSPTKQALSTISNHLFVQAVPPSLSCHPPDSLHQRCFSYPSFSSAWCVNLYTNSPPTTDKNKAFGLRDAGGDYQSVGEGNCTLSGGQLLAAVLVPITMLFVILAQAFFLHVSRKNLKKLRGKKGGDQ
jgi:hypothetical protein